MKRVSPYFPLCQGTFDFPCEARPKWKRTYASWQERKWGKFVLRKKSDAPWQERCGMELPKGWERYFLKVTVRYCYRLKVTRYRYSLPVLKSNMLLKNNDKKSLLFIIFIIMQEMSLFTDLNEIRIIRRVFRQQKNKCSARRIEINSWWQLK